MLARNLVNRKRMSKALKAAHPQWPQLHKTEVPTGPYPKILLAPQDIDGLLSFSFLSTKWL